MKAMNIVIDDYEVEIRARKLNNQVATNLDTIEFLLYLRKIFERTRKTALEDKVLLNKMDKNIDSINNFFTEFAKYLLLDER